MDAKVLYDYVARGLDELTIKQGDIIQYVCSTDMDGWLSGTLEGRDGIFPGNFIEVIEEHNYQPPTLPSSPPPSSSSSKELRTDFCFPVDHDHNQMGAVVPEEEEWWKRTLKGEVEVFAPHKKVHTTHGSEKAVMLGRSISEQPTYSSYPIQSSKRVAIVKPLSPEVATIPVPHTSSEETAAERMRHAQQVSRMDPGRIQSMEEKLRHVFSGGNGPTGNLVHSGNSNLPRNMEGEGDNDVGESEDVLDLVSNMQMKRGRTVSEVGDEHGKFFAGTSLTPGPLLESKPSSTHLQSRLRHDPIPNKEEFKTVRRHSSMSGKTAMMTMIDNMMRGGEQSQVGPTTPSHPSHQTNAYGKGLRQRSLPIAGAEIADPQRGVGGPSSSSNYANIFKDNPGPISSSMSPSTPSHSPTPPPSHTKPMPSFGSSTSSNSTGMGDAERWMKPAEISRSVQGPPPVPNSSPPHSPPHMQVEHESISQSSSTAEEDGQGRSALLDAIRAQLAKRN